MRARPSVTSIAVRFKAALLSGLLVSVLSGVPAAAQPAKALAELGVEGYEVAIAQVAMRDGVKLETLIVRPNNASVRYPFLLERTPYSSWDDPAELRKQLQGRLRNGWRELSEDGYIFVVQHIRGRYGSGGDYVMYRGGRDRSDPRAVDDSTDAYDTIAWLLENVPGHNGRVGVMGGSNPGTLAAMTLIDPHPALKAVSPQAPAVFQFTGDDFIHYGAFSLSPNYAYSQWTMWQKTPPEHKRKEGGMGNEGDLVGYDYNDHYEFFLRLGPLRNVNERFFKGQMPLWDELISHPNFDEYWRSRDFAQLTSHTDIPTLIVGGYYDPQDQKGPFGMYDTLKKSDRAGVVRLVVGPWLHGSWNTTGNEGGRRLGALDFGTATADVYRASIQAPFFAHYLHDKGPMTLGSAIMFQTGSNRWIHHAQYPPAAAKLRQLYLQPNHGLAFTPPKGQGSYSEYVHDPRYPIPHAPRPIPYYYTPKGQLWRLEDQRFASLGPDSVYFQTEELQEDVTLAGEVLANLYASTSGTDADWVVKLIDVHPQDLKEPVAGPSGVAAPSPMAGFHYLVTAEVFRAKYRQDLSKPRPVTAGAVVPYRFSLLSRDHVFKKGHRILVQVQSSWFPMFDINPGKFVNIPEANEADFQRTTQRIYHSARYPSAVDLHLLPVKGQD